MPESHPPFRIGHGYDLHRLQPTGKLLLASVLVSDQLSPIAHSDGDVILHAPHEINRLCETLTRLVAT